MVPFLVPNAAGGFQYIYGNPFQQLIGGIGGVGGGTNVQVPLQPVIAPQPVTGTGGDGGGSVIPPGGTPPGVIGGGVGGAQVQVQTVIPPQPVTGTGGGGGGSVTAPPGETPGSGVIGGGGTSAQSATNTGETSSRIEEVEHEEESEEEEEDDTIKETLLNFMKEMKEARQEDRERQEKLEERLKKAEENKSHPPNERGRGEGPTDRGRDNRGSGPVDGDRKGQCRNQLMGRQCDRNCQYAHKSICRPYREKGRQGCHDRRCNLLHPYDCRSVSEGWICDRMQCHA